MDLEKVKKGEIKNLKGADLRGADLRGANLIGADLRRANLRGANLIEVDLRGAYLKGANLIEVDLRKADLRGSDLIEVNLTGANLTEANLRGADLTGVNLRKAYLKGVDLKGADLKGADLREANLKGVDLTDIKIDYMTVGYSRSCPEEGSFIGYKKARNCLVKLLILEDSKRSSATTMKCRCDKAKVLEIEDIVTGEKINSVASSHDSNFIYEVGKIVKVDNFNEDRWNECASGIHFFMNRENAINY